MSDPDAIPADDVIAAAADDLIDIDGAPDNPLAAVLGGGGFDFGALLEQASVSDDKKTVGQLLKENGVTVKRFVRFAAGA